jgi:hypothetical protein
MASEEVILLPAGSLPGLKTGQLPPLDPWALGAGFDARTAPEGLNGFRATPEEGVAEDAVAGGAEGGIVLGGALLEEGGASVTPDGAGKVTIGFMEGGSGEFPGRAERGAVFSKLAEAIRGTSWATVFCAEAGGDDAREVLKSGDGFPDVAVERRDGSDGGGGLRAWEGFLAKVSGLSLESSGAFLLEDTVCASIEEGAEAEGEGGAVKGVKGVRAEGLSVFLFFGDAVDARAFKGGLAGGGSAV